MKERPILMRGEMVLATLNGLKTETRRLVKPQPKLIPSLDSPRRQKRGDLFLAPDVLDTSTRKLIFACALDVGTTECLGMVQFCEKYSTYGQVGDRLWVKETFAQNEIQLSEDTMDTAIVYRADNSGRAFDNLSEKPWTPSIFMSRWASRITLEITGVRVERLQEISQEGAKAEGCRDYSGDPSEEGGPTPIDCYKRLWDEINGKGSWKKNPWVWVITFKHAHD